jgi:hypothetical protein
MRGNSPGNEVHAREFLQRHQLGKAGSTGDEWQRRSILVADEADKPVDAVLTESFVRRSQQEKRRSAATRPWRHPKVRDLSDDNGLVSLFGLAAKCRHCSGEPLALKGQKGAKHTAKTR